MMPAPASKPVCACDRAALLSPGRFTVGVAWAGLVAAVLPTRDGSGGFCWVHTGTGVPCPGCGMTRSLGHAVRGDLRGSWQYHPFGLPLLLVFAGVAVISLLPPSSRRMVSGWLRANDSTVGRFKLGFLALFVGYGVVRACLQVLHLHEFGL